MIEFFVTGKPATAGSLKSYGKGKLTHASERTKTWEDWIRWIFLQSDYARMCLYSTAVRATLIFYFPRPNSHFKKDGSLSKKGQENPYPAWKGRNDVDKLQRAVFDALTGYVYDDDGRIADVHARKEWSEKEGVLIKISKLRPK